MQQFWDIAPPGTWALLSVASTFLLAGFVLLSHTLVRSKAHGDRFSGLLHPGRLEWTLRLGVACLAFGVALWGEVWGWPAWTLLALAGAGVTALALEAAARLAG